MGEVPLCTDRFSAGVGSLSSARSGRWSRYPGYPGLAPTPETTQEQICDFFSQLPYKCHPSEVASVGD